MKIFTRPILEINLNNLLLNYKTLKTLAKGSVAAAVVKDDAYGIGAVEVVKKLYNEADCRHFFVAHAAEAERVCKHAPEAKFYVLQGIGTDNLAVFKKHKFVPVIGNIEMFWFWMENKVSGVKPVINLETGLNRLGFRESDLKQLSAADKKEFSMVMTHYACADELENPMNEKQVSRFDELRMKYLPKLPTSLAASDGVFLGKKYHGAMVRLGGAMYGLNTTPYHTNKMKCVVRVLAPVLQIADLKRGDYVGYSATYQAQTDEKIAIISIGYGDGLFRSLSNKRRVLGRISMDNTIVDGRGLEVGEFVEVMGPDYDQDAMAKDAGTIGYEILSRFGKGVRFLREYVGKACFFV